MGSVKLVTRRSAESKDSNETPDQALSRARQQVREARRRRERIALRSRLSHSSRSSRSAG